MKTLDHSVTDTKIFQAISHLEVATLNCSHSSSMPLSPRSAGTENQAEQLTETLTGNTEQSKIPNSMC